MRAEKLLKNSITGIILQVVSILIAFISRKLFLYFLGIEYVGANGLFSNVLSLLSISELGFSSAITYHLYKPLKDNDQSAIASLMHFYRQVYRIIALFITIMGIIVSFFLPYIVGETSFNQSFLKLIYFLFLFQTVSSYFFSYKLTIIDAQQENYLFFWYDFIIKIVLSSVNLICICVFKNYIVYLTTNILINFLNNVIKSVLVTKRYPILKEKSKLDSAEKSAIYKDVKNLFIGQLSTKVLTSTDNIVISRFLTLLTVGLYDNYVSIQNYVMNFINAMTRSLPSAIASTTVNEEKQYTYRIMKIVTQILFMIATFCSICLFTLSTDFIHLLFGKQYILQDYIILTLSVSFFIQIVKMPLWYTIKGTGLFDKDKYISLAGAISNIIISILLVTKIGLVGVILGTILSQLLQYILKFRLLFIHFLQFTGREYLCIVLRCTILYIVNLGILTGITKGIECASLNIYLTFIIKGFLCVSILAALLLLEYHKCEGFQYLLNKIKQHKRK